MKPRETILVSKADGKRYWFKSLYEADKFLKRPSSYIINRVAKKHRIMHLETREEFDAIINGETYTASARKGTQFMQLCWGCKKYINGCNWSRKGIPVDGWEAEPCSIKLSVDQTIPSYKIKSCPEYEPD